METKTCPFLKSNCTGFECALFLPVYGKDNKRYGKCTFILSAETNMKDSDKTDPVNVF